MSKLLQLANLGSGLVSTPRIQMASKGRQQPFNNAPNFSSVDYPWAGYLFEEMNCRLEPVPSHSWPKTVLCLCTGGEGSAHWRHRGIWRTNRVRPGSAFIVRRDAEVQALQATIGWQNMLLQLDNSSLRHIAPDEVTLIEKSLAPAQSTNDARLAALMLAMRQEVREGCSSGRLFGESISLALLAYLAGKYATLRCASTGQLSPAQKRRLVDYIRENLSSDITVMELADLVQLSPSHFARTFKASFGVAPYRFVMRERIDGAKDMLASAKLSSSQVAMAYGFASQSHFVKVFRQFTGVTPKQYRAGA
jgi:AraC family transcriptional regulator